jgi:ABC-type transporter Mla subunit MlaD
MRFNNLIKKAYFLLENDQDLNGKNISGKGNPEQKPSASDPKSVDIDRVGQEMSDKFQNSEEMLGDVIKKLVQILDQLKDKRVSLQDFTEKLRKASLEGQGSQIVQNVSDVIDEFLQDAKTQPQNG